MKILVYIDQRDSQMKKASLEAIAAARKIEPSADNVAAIVVGCSEADAKEFLQGRGAGKLYFCDDSKLKSFNAIDYKNAVSQVIESFSPNCVMAVATPMAKEFFPRLAAKHDGAICSDVIEVTMSGSEIEVCKPMYAGKCLANITLSADSMNFITVRPNSVPAMSGDADIGSSESVNWSGGDNKLSMTGMQKGESEKPDLTEAEIIISGGRAMANADNFKILHECADVLGATVGASRAAVDSGYASHDMQVGQTGKTVNPNLYIACGISGSIQHMAGMRTSKYIVAINTDKDAPIFKIADYGIVADLFEAVPALTEKLKSIR